MAWCVFLMVDFDNKCVVCMMARSSIASYSYLDARAAPTFFTPLCFARSCLASSCCWAPGRGPTIQRGSIVSPPSPATFQTYPTTTPLHQWRLSRVSTSNEAHHMSAPTLGTVKKAAQQVIPPEDGGKMTSRIGVCRSVCKRSCTSQ